MLSDTFCYSRACQKATGPLFFSTWTLSATDIHIHVSDGFNDTNEISFHKSPKNYMVHQAWTSCATLVHLFFPPKINIAISENGHESLCVATPPWPSVGMKPNTWESWGFGVLRDSRMFRARQQGTKHLALGCSWCRCKGLET